MPEREEYPSLPLAGHRVAVAGRLATLSKTDVERVVKHLGGCFVRRADQTTTLLVVGEASWPLNRQGRIDRNLRRVLQEPVAGTSPSIVEEREFLLQFGALSSAMLVQRYTLREISRLVGLSCRRLQGWIDRGWVRPHASGHGIALFDYQAIARMRQLSKLLASGVPPARLARSLRQLRRWRADAEQGLVQLSVLIGSHRLLTRLPDGRLVEPGGQLLLPIEEASDETAVSLPPPALADDPADLAWELEQEERHSEAAEAYERALEVDTEDAQLWLNYGNVLYVLGRVQEAADAFRRATNLEPTFAAAWNNLGAACLDLLRFEEAEAALRQALAIEETCQDARDNLADLLRECGRNKEPGETMRIYLVQ